MEIVEKRIVPSVIPRYVVDDEIVWFSLSFSLKDLYLQVVVLGYLA